MKVAADQVMNGRDPTILRGDPITGDRYICSDFATKEWEHLWKKIWHVAGRENELQQTGDFIVHNFMKESVMVVKQEDGSLKAFYNVCGHRGLRLVSESSSVIDGFHCPYHGWLWGIDGALKNVQDPEDFPENPCGKLKLGQLRCKTWGGFVWYTMDDDAPDLFDYLSPIPELYKNYPLETLVRVFWMRIDLPTNWKFATDNFSESYHTRTTHPQVPPWIDQDYWTSRHEIWSSGHGRTVQPMRPSLSDRLPAGQIHPFDQILEYWAIDSSQYDDFETKVMQGWLDLKAKKRATWRARGYEHYSEMNDEQLTDSLHTVIFPNITISFLPDNIIFFRTEPHPDDPEKCFFDLWCMAFPVDGLDVVESIMAGQRPMEEASFIHRDFDDGRGVPEIEDSIVYQDMMLARALQQGMHSAGYKDSNLAGQETRVRFFHEVLNDYLKAGVKS
ncbi:MAG: (2Fe-2S)-binding protein [Porticoccaceae bacterium]|jgi:phenylpropionate dioxygenase-like ring-hydroxylating dioxygenase large terminal subunit|nr:(2Fe-2S)-binding protein [Porticoccaceae bacterium]